MSASVQLVESNEPGPSLFQVTVPAGVTEPDCLATVATQFAGELAATGFGLHVTWTVGVCGTSVAVAVLVGVRVAVAVFVGPGVAVGVFVLVGVFVPVGVLVTVGVGVIVVGSVGVGVSVMV